MSYGAIGVTGATGITSSPTSINKIYVVNNADSTVSVIDGNTNSIIASHYSGRGPAPSIVIDLLALIVVETV